MAVDTLVQDRIVNGVDTDALGKTAHEFVARPQLARFRFRAHNRWAEGSQNVTTIDGYYGADAERTSAQRPFTVSADEPDLLLGRDAYPNPAEHLLHALAACVTTSIVYHAAQKGIRITAMRSTLEGELDLRGMLGLAGGVRPGFSNVRVTVDVTSDAPAEDLAPLANFSPVLDMVRNGTRVDVEIKRSAPTPTGPAAR